MFLVATIGFAVGLGNLWRFPYLTGENGGGAFILLYVGAVILIGLPLVIVELTIGRTGGPDPAKAWAFVAKSVGASRLWATVGHLGVVASFVIISFYSVIGGWTLAFAWNAAIRLAVPGPDLDFDQLLASPLTLVFWQTLYIALNMAIIRLGLQSGVERAMAVMMPLLLLTLIVMLGVAAVQPTFGQAVEFLFAFDPSFLTWKVAITAVGQGFFSVGVAAAVLVTYGGYLGPGEKIGSLSVIIVFADTIVALLAGLVIFPFVFAAGLDPTEGPTLLFVTMQAAFATLPGGAWLAAVFFSLVVVAALASSVALFEMLAAIGESRGIARGPMLGWGSLLLWILGLGTVASFNIGADWRPLAIFPLFENANFFGVLDILTSTIALPLGGLLASIFAGWRVPRQAWADQLNWPANGWALRTWIALLRFVIPPILVIALFAGMAP